MLAKLQQKVQDRTKLKYPKQTPSTKPPSPQSKPPSQSSTLRKERQKRDYCRANGLCYWCNEKYDPAHAEVCTKRPKAQANALSLNNLDVDLNENILAQLELEDALSQDFGQLSLNALAGTSQGQAMRVRALVKNKVMLLLVDSGNSHSFINSSFFAQNWYSICSLCSQDCQNGKWFYSAHRSHCSSTGMVVQWPHYHYSHESARLRCLWCNLGIWLASVQQPNGVWLGGPNNWIWTRLQKD